MDSPHSHLVGSQISTSKTLLAKFMAMENIRVIQSKDISTPYFNLETRVLGLPIWKEMSDDLYSMFIGHEVGHALYTPLLDPEKKSNGESELQEIFDEFGTIFEDPLKGDPLFQTVMQLCEDSRIDRKMKRKYPGLNKNYREGIRELVEISKLPKPSDFDTSDVSPENFLDRLLLHIKVAHYYGQKTPFLDEELPMVYAIDESDSMKDVVGVSIEVFEYLKKFNENSSDVIKSSTVLSDYEDAVEKVTGVPDSSQIHFSGDTQKEEYDSEEITIDVTNISALPYILYFDDAIQDLIQHYYSVISKSHRKSVDRALLEFKLKSMPIVNHMAQEFMMRKSAREFLKSRIHTTGSLDMRSLHRHSYDHNIFKTVEVKNKGKSHGLILLLDMSGSMHSCFLNSVLQIFNLVLFCKAINIPFEMYGFTSNGPISRIPDDTYKKRRFSGEELLGKMISRTLTLNHYFSSRMNLSGIHLSMIALLTYAFYCETDSGQRINSLHSLNNTPLNAALVVMKDIFWKFKNVHKLDVVHTICVTDGVSDQYLVTEGVEAFKRCNIVNGPFQYRYEGGTSTVLDLFRDETNSKVVSLYLSKSSLENGEGYREILGSKYDKEYVIDPDLLGLDIETTDLKAQSRCRPLLRSLIEVISS